MAPLHRLAVPNIYSEIEGAGGGFNVRGFRNMNLGNIGYGPWARAHGATGAAGTDTGHGVAVFPSFAKYLGGRHTALELIAGAMGWTPGNRAAAANIARAMGIGAGDDLRLDNPAMMDKFLHGLAKQELGPGGAAAYFRHVAGHLGALAHSATRAIFGHPHQHRESAVPPHHGTHFTLHIQSRVDGRIMSNVVEHHLVRKHRVPRIMTGALESRMCMGRASDNERGLAADNASA
jgi:hypothetical protein